MNNALITQSDRSKIELVDFRPARRQWVPKAVVLLVVLFIAGLVNARAINEHAALNVPQIDFRQ